MMTSPGADVATTYYWDEAWLTMDVPYHFVRKGPLILILYNDKHTLAAQIHWGTLSEVLFDIMIHGFEIPTIPKGPKDPQ